MAGKKDQRPEVVLSRLGFVNLGINDIFRWDHFLRRVGYPVALNLAASLLLEIRSTPL